MTKKNKKTLTYNEKFEIIQFYEKYKKVSYVRLSEIFTQRFQISLTDRTIKNIIDSKSQIIENISRGFGNITKTRPVKHDILEDSMKKWIAEIEGKGGFITDKLISVRAGEIIKKENIKNMKLSSGWVDKFKKRNKLTLKNIHGEAGATEGKDNEEIRKEFSKKLVEKIASYSPKNVFNADETGIFYKQMPVKSLLTKVRKGLKNYKDRVSVLLCANMDGSEKIKPLLIGKSERPIPLRKFDFTKYVSYSNSAKSWMNTDIFNNFLLNWDIKLKDRKICLVVDNCSAHKVVDNLKNIEVIFLPPNQTSCIQPLDMGIIRSFKAHFNHQKIYETYLRIESGISVEESFKKINMKDVVLFTSLAWRKVSKETIQNCFRAASWVEKDNISNINLDLDLKDCEEEFNTFIKKHNIKDNISFKEYSDVDFDEKSILNYGIIEDQKKSVSTREIFDESEEIENNIEEVVPEVKISYSDCQKMLVELNKFASYDENFNASLKKNIYELTRSFRALNLEKEGIKHFLIKK